MSTEIHQFKEGWQGSVKETSKKKWLQELHAGGSRELQTQLLPQVLEGAKEQTIPNDNGRSSVNRLSVKGSKFSCGTSRMDTSGKPSTKQQKLSLALEGAIYLWSAATLTAACNNLMGYLKIGTLPLIHSHFCFLTPDGHWLILYVGQENVHWKYSQRNQMQLTRLSYKRNGLPCKQMGLFSDNGDS